MNSVKKKLLWSVVFILIAGLSIWAVTQNNGFSFSDFLDFASGASVPFIICAVASMLAFILFESAALCLICRSFGYKCSFRHGFSYAASDIYVSAITPSASGGQPACAYFMIKDGIPPIFAAVALVANLVAYTSAIIFIALLCLIFAPGIFLSFNAFSRFLIVLGILLQLGLLTLLLLLLKKESWFRKICNLALKFLRFIRLKKRADNLEKRLDVAVETYAEYAKMLAGKKKMFFGVFVLNFLQRAFQIAVTSFVFLAVGGSPSNAVMLWFMQSYVVVGSNCIPIPGAMGVTDYLMLDGFGSFMSVSAAANLELLSRSLSFYFCIIICGIAMLIKFIIVKQKNRKVS